LVAPDEPLTPGALYVAVATLTGSVIARNRSILARAFLPSALLILSAHQFLPKTTHNIRSYASDLEDTYTPGLSHVHETGKAHTAMAVARVQESLTDGYTAAERSLGRLLGRVQDTTGLKVQDASTWGRRAAEDVKHSADGVVAKVKERVIAAEGEAKVKATEIVNAVKHQVAVAEKEAEKSMDAANRKVEEMATNTAAKKAEAANEVERVVNTPVPTTEQPPKRLV
jgi:organizing structure protein 2